MQLTSFIALEECDTHQVELYGLFGFIMAAFDGVLSGLKQVIEGNDTLIRDCNM